MRQLQAGALTRFVRARFQTTDVDAPSDGQLLECFRTRRDETAFELLVRRHGPMVAQVARRVLHDRHDAEDVYQAVFLVLARRANSVRKSESVGGWLHGVAYRLAQRAKVDAARRREREKQAAPKSPADPLAQAAWQELQSVLDEQIFQLPAACRSAVVLCYLEGKTRDEAAQQLGLSLRTLHRRLERGRTLLRLRLERMGLTLSAGLLAAALSKSAGAALLPVALVNSATRAAMGSSVDVSVRVLSLAETASQMTGVKRFKGGIAFLMILGVLAAGAVAVIQQAWSTQKQSAAVGGDAKNEAAPVVRKDLAGDPLPRGAVARLGTVRFRAPAETSSLTLSPDGKMVAVDSIVGVFLFDANFGQRRRNLGKLRSSKPWKENLLAFSPNGKYLAGRGLKIVEVKKGYYRRKGIVRLWDVAATKKPKEFAAENAIWLGWSGGGQLLVVCAEKGAVALHELANRKSKRFTCPDLRQPRRSDYTRCICAPDGQTLAVFDAKDILHVWDTASGKERFAVPAQKKTTTRVGWRSPQMAAGSPSCWNGDPNPMAMSSRFLMPVRGGCSVL